VPDSDVLRVGFRCSDPRLAQTLANSLGEHAIAWHIDKYRQSGNVSFLQEQVERAREQVEQTEQELSEARSRLNLISIDERRKLLVENQFRARARLNEIVARRAATSAGMRSLGGMSSTQMLGAVRPQLLNLSAERGALGAEEAEVRKQVAAYDQELAALNDHEHEIKGMERRMESRVAAYSQLMNSLQQARTHDAKQHARIANVVIIQSAALPLEPVKPRKWFLILLSTGGALLLVLAWAFVLEFNDTSFGSEAELRAGLGAEVLGTIPRTRWSPPKERGERRVQA
jgi:tyrosine-protein kinase Etk/Wzc